MSEYLLEVRNVNKSFGGVVTANDVCMSVEPGQIRGLIGPNGAGKTTLLNLISGIYDVDGGNIFFNGKDVTKLPTHVRAKMGIGRTFQSPRFMNRASIEDNLKVGTDLLNQFGYIQSFFGKKGHDFMKNLEELMEIAGFTFDWQDQITSLPYGQQKLLAGVEFTLEKMKDDGNGKLVVDGDFNKLTGVTNAQGVLKLKDLDGNETQGFTELKAGTYRLTETKAAENYNLLSAPILVTFGKDGTCTLNGSTIEVSAKENKPTEFTKNEDGSYTLALTVLNRKTPALPHTGADAPSLWLLIGLPLAVAGLLILVFRYNKKGGRTR